jgi:hypothetical protein
MVSIGDDDDVTRMVVDGTATRTCLPGGGLYW